MDALIKAISTQQHSRQHRQEQRASDIEDAFLHINSQLEHTFAVPENYKEYLDMQLKHLNLSANNVLLVQAQMPEAVVLKSAAGWQEVGRSVADNAEGITILARNGSYLDIGTIYDISDTKGKTYIESKRSQPSFEQLINAMVNANQIPKIIDNDRPQEQMGYDHAHRAIYLRSDMGEQETIEVLAEELAHSSIGYQTRDNYDFGFYSLSAYSAAYIICEKYGLDTSSFSFDEIADFSEQFTTDEKRDMLNRGAEAAKYLCYKIDKELQPVTNKRREHASFNRER